MGSPWMVGVAVAVVVASCVFNLLMNLVWRPYALTRRFRAQGMHGPGYKFFVGSLSEIKKLRAATAGATLAVGDHDVVPLVQPHLREWITRYGRTFVYWTGARPNVCVADMSTVSQVLFDRTGLFPKTVMNPHLGRLLGRGLVFIDGDEWRRHRRAVHPAFDMDKLKMMTATISDCAGSRMAGWAAQVAKGGGAAEIELSGELEELTADVISHTAFGTSYREGKQVFLAQRELLFLAFSTSYDVHVPGLAYLPTKKNLRTRQLDKTVRATLMAIIKNRLAAGKHDAGGYGDDLLGLMLEAACAPASGGAGESESPAILSMDEIVDECKTFFFAGQDTTSHLLAWAMLLLATHPEWQDKLREEVRRECGGAGEAPPTGDELSRLRLVTMFLLETLRLYGPASQIHREAGEGARLAGVELPRGTIVTIPVATIHRDAAVWGADAGEFRPERFANGATRAARHPNALLAFSAGPRSCIGQNFAMIEAKAVVAMALQRFVLELSPRYVHAPLDVITLRPRHGLPMLLKTLRM
ncbi:hypothetical protein ACP4OV_022780 [Aristida adscensionis]